MEQAPPSSLLQFVRIALGVAALGGALYSAVVARALQLFRRDTGPAIARAVELVPMNSAYLLRLAAWQPQNRHELLRRAVAVNPYEEDAWTRLGLEAELQQRNLAQAETDFLRAAAVDHMFLPRWTAVNFYFRQQRRDDFFHWAHLALQVTPYPADPVLAEMWLFHPEASAIAAYIPDRPSVLAQYVLFLANVKQFDAISPVVTRLVKVVGPAGAGAYGLNDIVGPVVDQMVGSGYGVDALQVWKALADGRWIATEAPSESHPLTNGDFRHPLWPHAFDWTPATLDGLSASQDASAPELQLQLSGEEPEHSSLLRLWLPVVHGRSYAMSWVSDAQGMPTEAGFRWTLHAATVELHSPSLIATHAWSFVYDGPTQMALLTLDYDRPWGQTRASGSLNIRSVTLQPK